MSLQLTLEDAFLDRGEFVGNTDLLSVFSAAQEMLGPLCDDVRVINPDNSEVVSDFIAILMDKGTRSEERHVADTDLSLWSITLNDTEWRFVLDDSLCGLFVCEDVLPHFINLIK